MITGPKYFPANTVLSSCPLIGGSLISEVIVSSGAKIDKTNMGPSKAARCPGVTSGMGPCGVSSRERSSRVGRRLRNFSSIGMSFAPRLIPIGEKVRAADRDFLGRRRLSVAPRRVERLCRGRCKSRCFVGLVSRKRVPRLDSIEKSGFMRVNKFRVSSAKELMVLSYVSGLIGNTSNRTVRGVGVILKVRRRLKLGRLNLRPWVGGGQKRWGNCAGGLLFAGQGG